MKVVLDIPDNLVWFIEQFAKYHEQSVPEWIASSIASTGSADFEDIDTGSGTRTTSPLFREIAAACDAAEDDYQHVQNMLERSLVSANDRKHPGDHHVVVDGSVIERIRRYGAACGIPFAELEGELQRTAETAILDLFGSPAAFAGFLNPAELDHATEYAKRLSLIPGFSDICTVRTRSGEEVSFRCGLRGSLGVFKGRIEFCPCVDKEGGR